MTEPVTLIVSVDTEEDNWTPVPYRLTVENIRALPGLDRVLERIGARATYFTTYQVAATPWTAEIMRGLAGTGRAEVGAHLHPWSTPPLRPEFTPSDTMLANLPPAAQRAKIHALTDELEIAIGRRPRSFRAGRWGLDAGTADALIACGYRVDSSVTPFKSWTDDHGPSHVGAPLDVYRLGGQWDHRVAAPLGPLVEVPVSSAYLQRRWRLAQRINRAFDVPALRRRGALALGAKLHLFNHVVLSPEIEAVEDMVTLVQRLLAHGVRHLHLTFHSSSLVPGLNPFIRTAADAERFNANLQAIVDRIGAMTAVRFATVSEAAAILAPPLRITAAAAAVPHVLTEKRLLVTTYHFPPDPAIGGMRWAGLTRYLAADGWRSWVVTAAPPPERVAPWVTVASIGRLTTVNDIYRRVRARSGRDPSPRSGETPSAMSAARRLMAHARYEAGVLITLPDEARGWVLRAALATRRLIARVRPSTLVSSGPPHSAHVAAWLATRFTSVSFVADLRDPWAGPSAAGWEQTSFVRSKLFRWVNVALERLVLRSADTIICNTREFAAALAVRYPRSRIEWVPNGVDRALLPRVTAALFPGLGIVHVGTIYGGRDLGPVLLALRDFLDRHPDAATDGTCVRIAGSVDESHVRTLRRQITELRLDAQVELLGVLPRADALELVGRSQLAVVLAQHQEFQVPAKLYEMVAMGVPTVVLATTTSAASREARRLGAAAIDPDDRSSLVALMESVRDPVGAAPLGAAAEADYRTLAPRVGAVLLGAMRYPHPVVTESLA